MASALQNVIPDDAGQEPRPAVQAASPPSSARANNAATPAEAASTFEGATAITTSGNAAPAANARADATAACSGRAKVASEIPEFVPCVGAERVVAHQLPRDVSRQVGIEPRRM